MTDQAESGEAVPLNAPLQDAAVQSAMPLQLEPEPTSQPPHKAESDNGIQDRASTASGQDLISNDTTEPKLSKSQQRKLARQERFAATKLERRAREKAARKEKLAEKRRLVEEEGADPYEIGLAKKKKPRKGDKFNANVVIDLGFDDKMSEKDIKSMSTQLAHVYNVNRNAVHSVNVIFTPLEGQLKQRMVEGRKADYLRWKGLQVYEKPIEQLWNPRPSSTIDSAEGIEQPQASTSTEQTGPIGEVTAPIRKGDVIYLTADSKNVLSTLDEGKTYVVGGIVDHNRYKNLCLGIAQKHGVVHAALPISQYVEMASRKVLTVNQCFEIMSKWLEYRDWEKAFYEVIPKRKFDKVKDSGAAATASDDEDAREAKSEQIESQDEVPSNANNSNGIKGAEQESPLKTIEAEKAENQDL